jgi:predicted phosphoribosyltransferase
MSKELEAIRVLKDNAILFDDGTDFGASMLEAISDLEKALTPPTDDEVCKALSEHYHIKVEYDKRFKQFESEHTWYAELRDGLLYIDELPPHLITLIGRFYEGEIK